MSADVEFDSLLVASRGPAHWPDIHVPTPIDGNTQRFMTNQTAIAATIVNKTFIDSTLLQADIRHGIIRVPSRAAQRQSLKSAGIGAIFSQNSGAFAGT